MRLCFATRNLNKIQEIQALLPDNLEILSLDDIHCQVELPETTETIAGNSQQKAQYVWDHHQVNCFADDSGLEVYTLNGEPGVNSAFYSGQRDDQANIKHLLQNLVDKSDRRARFITVITLIIDGKLHQFTGKAEGHILEQARGNQGFGYDPIFLPEGREQTFAQMSREEKNKISHRSQAFQQLVDFFRS